MTRPIALGLAPHLRRREPAAVRFWRHVHKADGDGCWEWTGGLAKGYGSFCDDRQRMVTASRFSYELAYGPIPKGEGYHGICVCHRCDNRKCVRPEHLFLGTNADNMLDKARKGRGVNPQALKTHCKWGHEFTPENTYNNHGGRMCRQCCIDRNARSARLKREAREKENAA